MPATVIPMTRRPLCNFFVASCEADGGIYEYSLFDGGDTELIRKIPCENPMYLARDGGKLYAVLRSPFQDSQNSGVAVFDEKSGRRIGGVISTGGAVGCHITAKDGDVYCANYIGGSICRLGEKTVLHEGCGVNKERQSSPHPHSVLLSPDCKQLFTADLGTDTVYAYTRELDLLTSASVPCGSGARHLAFSEDGKYLYCVGEMGGDITVFSWNGTALSPIFTKKLLKSTASVGSGAAIKLSSNGKKLYISERRECEIIALSADGENLAEIWRVPSGGKEPRDLIEVAGGKVLICANQWSGCVSIFSIEGETPTTLSSIAIPSPIALL